MNKWFRYGLILLGSLSLYMNLVSNVSSVVGFMEENSPLVDDDGNRPLPCPTTTTSDSNNHHHDNDNDKNKIVIFYNLYVSSVKEIPRVQQIFDEQMRHWNATRHGPVLVTSIAVPLPNLTTSNNNAAPPITLQSWRKAGMEAEGALDNLYDYCLEHPNARVAYLHSKGSYHATWQNERFRRVLTRAALSAECAQAIASSQCNVCSMRFSPIPHFHSPGNMWVATCEYIQQLQRPMEFRAVSGFTGKALRFADEHWVHSHATLNRPCDVYADASYTWSYKNLPTLPKLQANMRLQPAPRFDLETFRTAGADCDVPGCYLGQRTLDRLVVAYPNASLPDDNWWAWQWFDDLREKRQEQ